MGGVGRSRFVIDVPLPPMLRVLRCYCWRTSTTDLAGFSPLGREALAIGDTKNIESEWRVGEKVGEM